MFAPYVGTIDRVSGYITVDLAPFIPANMIVAQVVLPTVVTIVVDYLAVAGGMLFAGSQMTVDDDKQAKANILNRIRKDNQNLPRDGIK